MRLLLHSADALAQGRNRHEDGACPEQSAVDAGRTLFRPLGGGEAGYLSFTTSAPAGEGITTNLRFARESQIAIAGAQRSI